ncbi:acetyl/propionyl/methylcrotonyl-CoA carboxylase subunit alpha [Hydrogenophaga sp. MI9]|uniref:acetyl/propionyl/methylcrotonyl-CoA carboxylase subunit alpha n=1 Tax=Hydrogenophaga sp. MI9 TaxID=3453719 RepID=UPI003EEDF774
MKRLLIANRGEIARRILRTARRMGLSTVAVYSDADRDALHVREADAAVALGGTASADSYLRIDKLLDAARRSGADAVHPGYGFLSENADFAQAVIDAGLTWVGPPPAAIRALGSKSAAKAVALQQGVPVLPGYFGDDQRDETLIAEAQRIGFPLMVKAVAGGGGRGMRLVHRADQLPAALQSARSEALAGFGNGDLLIERALLAPRHVEVQVFADAHGHCIHLGERDCSVQRRHQKIIEESPSPAVSPELRAELGRCAVALAQGAGYVGAGTVEFLLEGDQFFLMEMNTRLQVEHPVTEMVTGLDLVEWQLRVARGEALPLKQEQVRLDGHAIEVRLCAEDDHFTPHAGTVQCFIEPALHGGLRFDHALESGAVVTPHYDAMLGKLIAHAPTRAEAIDRLAQALDDTVLLGLPNNRAFLAACLRHPTFRAGDAGIPFLAGHAGEVRATLAPSREALLAAALAASYLGHGPGDLPSPFPRPLRWRHGEETLDLVVREKGHGALQVAVGTDTHDAVVGDGVVTLDGVTRRATVSRQPDGRCEVRWGADQVTLDDLSHTAPASAGGGAAARELRALFNGKLVALSVQPGQRVARGQVLLTIESMKIEHQISAPRDATVSGVTVVAGQQLMPGQVLLVFGEDAA